MLMHTQGVTGNWLRIILHFDLKYALHFQYFSGPLSIIPYFETEVL